MSRGRAWSSIHLICSWACILLSLLTLESGANVTNMRSVEQPYRDFLVKLPTKDYRTKFGSEIYRHPKMKVLLMMHPSTVSEAVLKHIISSVSFHRHEVDVVFYYPQILFDTMTVDGLGGCRQVLATDTARWADTKELLLERNYDTMVIIPSEESVIDDHVVRAATQGVKKLAKQSILIPSLHFALIAKGKDKWVTLSKFFDFSLYWGSSQQLAMFKAELNSTFVDMFSSCKVLITQEDPSQFGSHFVNKVFLSIERLRRVQASSRLEGSAHEAANVVINLDQIELLRPHTVFLNQSCKVYVKTSYG